MAAPVVWQAQVGSQERFLACPIEEVLYQGTRGPGKTDAMLMDFAQYVGRGYGGYWRGVLFRRLYKDLDDVITKSKRWFPQIFPKARFLSSKGDYRWIFPDGEELLFNIFQKEDHYWSYHGHEYPWIGWEELCSWPDESCYSIMRACNRSSHPSVPIRYRASANPYGPGHHWVKQRFIDQAPPGRIIVDPASGKQRCHIYGSIIENRFLTQEYINTLMADPDPNRRKAWLTGSWDIQAGGILENIWNADVNVVRPFTVPSGWRVDRAFDWGSSKPYAVGWFAESDGTPLEGPDGEHLHYPRGTVFMIGELYGWNGQANVGVRQTNAQIAESIRRREADLYASGILAPGHQIYNGPADASIFDVINGDSYADEMERNGVKWLKSYKGTGSRVQGWEMLKTMLSACNDAPMERPGFFVFETCRQWIRTVPMLPRDDKYQDDVDTEAEDHMGDMTRYRLLRKPPSEVAVTTLHWNN